MSGAQFSNASTGDKPADPYKEKNYDNSLSVKDKVDGLVSFIKECRFGMMTTRQAQTGLLVSRCMALAGEVRFRSGGLLTEKGEDPEENLTES